MAWDKVLNRAASAPAKGIAAAEPDSVASLADLNPPEAKRETRRSKRVYISMPVLVKYQRSGHTYEEETVTDAVNAHGCLLRLQVALERGQKISITNLKSTQEVECRVAYVGQSEGGKTQAGVEFMCSSDYFWHIAFPPDDWNPSDRKRPALERPVAESPSKRA